MCGRYALYGPTSRMREQFGVEPDDWQDRYNIAPDPGGPTRQAPLQVPIVRIRDGRRELAFVQWSLLPFWSRERFPRYSTFNARIETVATAKSFREPFRYRRCILPASGFYEWQEVGGSRKQPWFIHDAAGRLLGFAGLWERWRGAGDEIVESCTVIVCPPDDCLTEVHDRMPVILAPDLYDDWLDPENDDPARLMQLLQANPGVPLARHRVGAAVGNSRNDGARLVEPIDPAER